jgi:hypothetical protein
VLLQEFGQDLVLALELVLEGSDLAVLGVLLGLASPAGVLKGGGAVLEELLLPAVEEGGVEAELVAQVGNGGLLQEVAAENGNLLLGGELATGHGHGTILR